MSIFSTLGVTIFDSTKETQRLLSPQCTIGAPVWIAGDSIYLQITLVLLKALYMHLIYPSLESEAIAG